MKRLAVLRHAKSSWADAGMGDFDRPLNDRGRKAARQIGEEIRARGHTFDFILASPAARVRETLDGVGELEGTVQFDPAIYHASAGQLLTLIRGLPGQAQLALLVGHNPGLEQLLGTIARDDSRGFRARIEGKYPTGALAIVDLDVEDWPDIEAECGEIAELILPKELDQGELG